MKNILCILSVLMSILTVSNTQAEEKTMSNNKNLIVYFSRTGEQYSVGNISKGNTAIVAEMIAEQTGGDLFEIKLQNDNYPAGYKALTEVALVEKNSNARPEIIGDVNNFAEYDTIFIGCPNWWADMPMAVYTFIEKHDWNGKTVIPFVTHEGSGLSSIPNKIKTATGAEVLDGIAIYGHEAQNSRDSAKNKVVNWLQKIGF